MSKVIIGNDAKFREYIIGRMKTLNVNQLQMAKLLKLKSRQAFAYKLKHLSFSYYEYRLLFWKLQTTKEELSQYFL